MRQEAIHKMARRLSIMDGNAKKIASVIGAVLIGPSSYGIYHVYDITNPTGNAWLEKQGFKFNPPKFTNQNNIGHGCADNLFSVTDDEVTKDNKLYGCTVMHMDLYNTGAKFHTSSGNQKAQIDPKYINFNSEVAIRKGTEGWVINTKIDNYTPTDKIHFSYLLTTYKYKSDENKWTRESTAKLWEELDSSSPNVKTELKETMLRVALTISTSQDKLHIQTPKHLWFDNEYWVYPSSTSTASEKKPVQSTQYAGIWIPDSQEAKWIFDDIEIWVKEKKYSQVFCKQEGATTDKCFQQRQSKKWKTNTGFSETTWDKVTEGDTSWTEAQSTDQDLPKNMIEKIKNETGKWISLKDVCGTRWTRNLDDNQKKQLRMFCINN